jgi:hypothetical protein
MANPQLDSIAIMQRIGLWIALGTLALIGACGDDGDPSASGGGPDGSANVDGSSGGSSSDGDAATAGTSTGGNGGASGDGGTSGSGDSGHANADNDAAAGSGGDGDDVDASVEDGSVDDDAASDPDLPDAASSDSGGADPDGAAELDGGGDPADGATGPDGITVTYRQGVNSYVGTKSALISNYDLGNPGTFNANGVIYGDGDNDWVVGTDQAPTAYESVWLIQFDALGLSSSVTVLGASLTIRVAGDGGATTLFLSGSYLQAGWSGVPDTCAGCYSSNGVGWRYRDAPNLLEWNGLGASGSDTDFRASPTFRIPEAGNLPATTTLTEYSTPLDPAVVQTWLNGQNYGLRIAMNTAGTGVTVVQPQRATSAPAPSYHPLDYRPQLSITYTP